MVNEGSLTLVHVEDPEPMFLTLTAGKLRLCSGGVMNPSITSALPVLPVLEFFYLRLGYFIPASPDTEKGTEFPLLSSVLTCCLKNGGYVCELILL